VSGHLYFTSLFSEIVNAYRPDEHNSVCQEYKVTRCEQQHFLNTFFF